MWRSGKDHYGIVSSGFHWAIALAIVGLVGLGAWMVGLTYYDPWYYDSLALHKAIGIVVLALALAKFGWKLVDRNPGFGPEVKPHERAGATAMHWLLNALMVLLPVTGYLISTSEGAGIDMFGLFDVPMLVDVTAATSRPRHRHPFLCCIRGYRLGWDAHHCGAQAPFRRSGIDAETHADPALPLSIGREIGEVEAPGEDRDRHGDPVDHSAETAYMPQDVTPRQTLPETDDRLPGISPEWLPLVLLATPGPGSGSV